MQCTSSGDSPLVDLAAHQFGGDGSNSGTCLGRRQSVRMDPKRRRGVHRGGSKRHCKPELMHCGRSYTAPPNRFAITLLLRFGVVYVRPQRLVDSSDPGQYPGADIAMTARLLCCQPSCQCFLGLALSLTGAIDHSILERSSDQLAGRHGELTALTTQTFAADGHTFLYTIVPRRLCGYAIRYSQGNLNKGGDYGSAGAVWAA